MIGTHPYYVRTLGDPFSSGISNVLSAPVLPAMDPVAFIKVLVALAGLGWALGKFRKG